MFQKKRGTVKRVYQLCFSICMTDPEPFPFPFFAPSDRLSHEAVGRADVGRHADYAAVANARTKAEAAGRLFRGDSPFGAPAADRMESQTTETLAETIARRLHLGMKLHERWLAEKAVARVKGAEDPLPEKSREEIVNLLVEDYRAFGLAQGDHSARELIREYESAVEDRAREEIGGQAR
ncbi:MAG: hypothetical protein ACRC1K_23135 [Planctomycetia bacterium]